MNSGLFQGAGQGQSGLQFPVACTSFHLNSVVVVGGALTTHISDATNHPFQHGTYQNPPAINNEWVNYFHLARGIYRFAMIYIARTNAGILTLSVDGRVIGSVDMYLGSVTQNQLATIADIALGHDGLHELRGKLTNKNGSSSDYDCDLTAFSFTPQSPVW